MPPEFGGFMDGVFLITIVSVIASLAIPIVIMVRMRALHDGDDEGVT